MKKKVISLLLTLCLVMTFVPMAAFAAGPDKISITTAAELLQFANAVDNGEYDGKTDAVVSLDADLDLTGVAWKPIGSVFDGDGNLLHYFSGKFYGNGHTISNLDFSENYGKTEYPSFGFFSEVYGAEISGLTIQGKLDVSNSGAVYFGTVAGVAADSKIFDCVSDVSFTDTDKYMPLPRAMLRLPISSTAKVMYARMLDIVFLSGIEDANGILFIHFPIVELAAALARSTMTVKRSLNELEDAGLILRVRQGFGEPNKIYVLIPKKEDSRL